MFIAVNFMALQEMWPYLVIKEMFNVKIIFPCDGIYMQTPMFTLKSTEYKKIAE
jgi:hypothetical protein